MITSDATRRDFRVQQGTDWHWSDTVTFTAEAPGDLLAVDCVVSMELRRYREVSTSALGAINSYAANAYGSVSIESATEYELDVLQAASALFPTGIAYHRVFVRWTSSGIVLPLWYGVLDVRAWAP